MRTLNQWPKADATIPLHWDDGAHTLTIGDRKAQFPGMLESRAPFALSLLDKTTAPGSTPQTSPTRWFDIGGSKSR
jgi:hypothetical protein